MKKILISLLSLFLALPFLWAVPADPNPFKYTQPDGSVIVLQNHGDEFFHWTTDELGRIVEKGADGFYRPSSLTQQDLAVLSAQAEQKRRMSQSKWSSYENPFPTNFGDRKVLCIIANFKDSTFIVPDPNTHFTNMLNQNGYSENGAIGSVRDYYIDNSRNQYRPEFDVFGPVDLTETSEYYDNNGVQVAIREAYELLKDQINIDDYDTDNDGAIDMILFYYPGHNQAEGAGEESIWPHRRTGSLGTLGGKRFVQYFCTSELRGADGTEPAAIGTTCHEFAHSLGIPDFYDTDYADNGGQNTTTGIYDLMCSGNYNDRGRRPPYLSAMERNMLGWMDYPEKITASGKYSLAAVQNNKAYQFETSVPGEYFILESRNGEKWDSYIASGLLVYHVDKSDRLVGGGMTAAELWDGSKINAYGGHPCYYLVKSVDNPSYWAQFIFPGRDNVTSLTPNDWNGNPAAVALTAISHNGSSSLFTATISIGRTVMGTVKDTDGKLLAGVEVSLTPSVVPFDAAPSLLSTGISCVTDESGSFTLVLADGASADQILTARKEGYVPACVNLSISSVFSSHEFVLLRQGEDAPTGLYKYDNTLPYMGGWYINDNQGSQAAGVKFTADDLAAAGAVGGQIKTVTFRGGAKYFDDAYVVVDIEDGASYRRKITDLYTPNTLLTIDISDAGIVIPAGKTVYIGYGFTNFVPISSEAEQYPFYAYYFANVDREAFNICYNFMENSSWGGVYFGDGQYCELLLSATIAHTGETTFSTLGVSYIQVEGGKPKVYVAAGKSLRSTSWYLDGASVSTPPAVSSLSAGTHTYMVRLNYYDGTSERVYCDVTVN